MPVASLSGGLALGVYAPALAFAALTAWPVAVPGAPGDGYLINCWAYRGREPGRNDWVWHRPSPWSEPRVGRVVAAAGDEVEWTRQGLRVNGEKLTEGLPYRASGPPDELAYTVPDDHLLILPDAGRPGPGAPQRLLLVPRRQVKGRAWARLYPVWERQLLR
jgi:signal peptidase I